MLQLGQVLADLLDHRDERAHREDGRRVAVLQLVQQLALLVQGVERGDDAAGEQRAVEGDEVLGAVGGEDGDAVALLDAVVLQEAARGGGRPPRSAPKVYDVPS